MSPESWSLSVSLISIFLISIALPTVASTACAAVPAPIAGFSYAQQYIRGNYADGNGTDHALGTAAPGTDWRQEYALGFGAFQSSTAKCAADCVYQLVAYTKPYNGSGDCDWDYRTLMMRMDPTTNVAYDPTSAYTAYNSPLTTTTSTLYCARQEGYCGAMTPLYLYYNKNTSDYVARGASQPNGTEEDPNSVIANGAADHHVDYRIHDDGPDHVFNNSANYYRLIDDRFINLLIYLDVYDCQVDNDDDESFLNDLKSLIDDYDNRNDNNQSEQHHQWHLNVDVICLDDHESIVNNDESFLDDDQSDHDENDNNSHYHHEDSRHDDYRIHDDVTGTYEPGDTVFPNGTIVRTNGDTVYPNGTVVTSDGWTIKDGTKIAPNGTVYNPNGSTTYPNGTTLNSDGSTTYPNGTTVTKDGTAYNPGGTVSYPNGTVAYPNGTTTYPDGSYQAPNGVTYYPNGTQKYEDGTVVSPDGTVTSPDGTVTYPNGTVVAPSATTKSSGGISLGWPLIILGVIVGAGLVIGIIYCLTIQFIKSGARAVSPEYYHQYEPYRSDSDMAPPRVTHPAAAAPPPFS